MNIFNDTRTHTWSIATQLMLLLLFSRLNINSRCATGISILEMGIAGARLLIGFSLREDIT